MNRSSTRPVFAAVLLLAACSSKQSSGTRASRPSGSGTVITAEDIQRSPGMSLEQLLLAHVPGLSLLRTDDGRQILHLRGSTSFSADQEALIVVNGIALAPNSSGNLSAINPQDIESITVLQDAASTAAYGSRGASGVILIRTKRS